MSTLPSTYITPEEYLEREIVEVLSESTKDYDGGQKFESYRALPSLMEYLTVAQDKMFIEQWARQADQSWTLHEDRDPAATLRLSSIAVELQLGDVYEKVEFSR